MNKEDKVKALESAIHFLTTGSKERGLVAQPFYGSMLQELNIKYSDRFETAAITYNEKTQLFEIIINPTYFCEHLTTELRVNLLHHEILHFTNKHLFRLPWLNATPEDRGLYNMAGDMAINQFLSHQAKGCATCEHNSMEEFLAAKCPGKWIDVANWKLDDGSPFPKLQTMEHYFDLIKKEQEKQKANPKTKGNVNEMTAGTKPMDAHEWDQLDEEAKRKMLEEAKKLIKRTVEKTQFGHCNVPDSIKDLLQDLDSMAAGLNYKQILKNTIKKTVSMSDRDATWKRPNRRYGNVSPGTKQGAVPVLKFYNDSSGSISITEQNEQLRIMDKFLQAGSRKCTLCFWHTDVYYEKPYKRGQIINKDDLESGGTDVGPTLENIKKTKPDLAIIYTDCYFDKVDIKIDTQVIWIVSKGGNPVNPCGHIGITIKLDNLKD